MLQKMKRKSSVIWPKQAKIFSKKGGSGSVIVGHLAKDECGIAGGWQVWPLRQSKDLKGVVYWFTEGGSESRVFYFIIDREDCVESHIRMGLGIHGRRDGKRNKVICLQFCSQRTETVTTRGTYEQRLVDRGPFDVGRGCVSCLQSQGGVCSFSDPR